MEVLTERQEKYIIFLRIVNWKAKKSAEAPFVAAHQNKLKF